MLNITSLLSRSRAIVYDTQQARQILLVIQIALRETIVLNCTCLDRQDHTFTLLCYLVFRIRQNTQQIYRNKYDRI